ncbi:MAG: nucleotidyl transferase AbiEii/AbiGii toxin family protein [Rhodospirillales bacterium]|nr:nucleotidyl transferase AbiEii/AbiGii toxin family protein [Rhodospirillales bacterium]
MAEQFLKLSSEERREALEIAASRSGRPTHLLEKDVWVVCALDALFESALGHRLVFKGGTSLSKAYKAIQRFSEDVDLTYDIRALAPDLVGDADDPLPATRSEENRWTSEVRRRLPIWAKENALPIIHKCLAAMRTPAQARTEGDRIFIAYEPIAAGSTYVRPEVMLEFGARSTGEPCDVHEIGCDAAEWIPEIHFPTARPRVMRAERTFWEKATAVHVYCAGGTFRGDRIARHWHDLARLDDAGIAAAALSDRDLAHAVARHKSMFFVEKGQGGRVIDYAAAVAGDLRLVPEGEARNALAADYDKMVADGLLEVEPESFDVLMARCADLEIRANTLPRE